MSDIVFFRTATAPSDSVGASSHGKGFVVVSTQFPFTEALAGSFWTRYGTGPTIFVLLGLAVALDDWVSHALGWWTLLD